MNDDELDAIEARAKAATKGPWKVDFMDMYIHGGDGFMVASKCPMDKGWQVRGHGAEVSGKRAPGSQDANAAFIASSRDDVDALAAEVRRLWAENDRLRRDRYEALTVHTKEGLLASEWVGRTGRAEAKLKAVKTLVSKWHVADDCGDMALRAMDHCADELESVLAEK